MVMLMQHIQTPTTTIPHPDMSSSPVEEPLHEARKSKQQLHYHRQKLNMLPFPRQHMKPHGSETYTASSDLI